MSEWKRGLKDERQESTRKENQMKYKRMKERKKRKKDYGKEKLGGKKAQWKWKENQVNGKNTVLCH